MRHENKRRPTGEQHIDQRPIVYRPAQAMLSDGSNRKLNTPPDCAGCASIFQACLCGFHLVQHRDGIFWIEAYRGDELISVSAVRFDGFEVTRLISVSKSQPGAAAIDKLRMVL